MFHDRSALWAARSTRPHPSFRPAFEAAFAWRDVGIEQANLSRRLFDNWAQLLGAAAEGDAGLMMSVFVASTARDLGDNAEAVSRIWRRCLREQIRAVSAQAPPDPFGAS
ncbi:hypothetical protein DFR50_11396 [Roseiarcus fermentans]|uniref:Uncharacterized protein n=1 Tax=Roseiarcus fermentans TaxID=1473586 RepID=A0A366FE68_9HYPH|nr:hypothetical protein [Roseiarcus fermentans]RBP12907.1 hypothetical protein DFR50_11396 [Roseiarcus fermentans]